MWWVKRCWLYLLLPYLTVQVQQALRSKAVTCLVIRYNPDSHQSIGFILSDLKQQFPHLQVRLMLDRSMIRPERLTDWINDQLVDGFDFWWQRTIPIATIEKFKSYWSNQTQLRWSTTCYARDLACQFDQLARLLQETDYLNLCFMETKGSLVNPGVDNPDWSVATNGLTSEVKQQINLILPAGPVGSLNFDPWTQVETALPPKLHGLGWWYQASAEPNLKMRELLFQIRQDKTN